MCQTACTSADFSFHGLIQNKTVLSFASMIYVTSLCCHSISLFLSHLSNSPLYVVILFHFSNFTFLLPPFYFATVFRHFILPLYFALLFCPSFFPIYFISPSFSALLFYFAILFRPLFISPFFFPLLFYFTIFFALYFISPFFFTLYSISPFFSPVCFVFFIYIFKCKLVSAFLYQVLIQIFSRTRGWIPHTTTLHTSHDSWEPETQQHSILFTTHNDSQRLIRLTTHETWNPTLHTFHNDSQRLTATHSDSQRLTTTHESQGESEIPHDSYDSRVTCFKRMYMIITRL